MPPLPLPRRGARSLLALALVLYAGYLTIKKLNSYSDPTNSSSGMVLRSMDMLQQYQGRGSSFVQAAIGGRRPVAAESDDGEGDGPEEEDDELLQDETEQAEEARGEEQGVGDTTREADTNEEPMVIPRKKHRTQSKRMPEHEFQENGLLKVNPAGQHPIFDLVEYAEHAWRNKTEKASKTLKQAVNEYRRRYGRAPPRGFDRWWAYAKKHQVQLPDEYDQIYRDLEPFHALKAASVITLVRQASLKDGMYTILCPGPDLEGNPRNCTSRVNERGLNEEGRMVAHERVAGQMDLIEEIQGMLEKVEVVYYSHDVPWQFIGHEFKSALEDSASVGEYYDTEEHELDSAHLGWASACAPHKPLREAYDIKVYPDLNAVWQETDKSFIWDHTLAMDPCSHPTITHLQGFLSAHGIGPEPTKDLYPVLAMCKTSLHSDVLAVSMENWTEDVGEDPPWDEKKDERLVWRGKTTGILFNADTPWELSQRINLVSRTAMSAGSIPVLPNTQAGRAVGLTREIPLDELNEDMMDIAFVEEPIQCEPETCAKLKNGYKFGERMTWDDSNAYKYVLDIDGNGWSARFKRLMTSKSLVLKSTIFPEWYSDRVQPWIHYVPVKSDLTDLYDIMTFFRSGHDDMARKIAAEGSKWSKTFWRKEDMVAYQFRLLLELSRLMSVNREAASYDGTPSPIRKPPVAAAAAAPIPPPGAPAIPIAAPAPLAAAPPIAQAAAPAAAPVAPPVPVPIAPAAEARAIGDELPRAEEGFVDDVEQVPDAAAEDAQDP